MQPYAVPIATRKRQDSPFPTRKNPSSKTHVFLARFFNGYLQSTSEEEIGSSYDFGDARDACAGLYDASGKCEKNMKCGKLNYGCSYMQGVQIGMSRDRNTIGVKRSLGIR